MKSISEVVEDELGVSLSLGVSLTVEVIDRVVGSINSIS